MDREPTVAQIEAACRLRLSGYDGLPKAWQISAMVEALEWWHAIYDATTSPQPDSPTPPSRPQS